MQKSCQEMLDTGNFTMVKLAPAVLQNRNTARLGACAPSVSYRLAVSKCLENRLESGFISLCQ